MKITLLYLPCFILVMSLAGCGGGSGNSSSPSTSSSEARVVTYTEGDKPGSLFVSTGNGSVEIFPTMIVTIDFKSNIAQEDLSKLSVVTHISADNSPDYLGQEFAYIFEHGKAIYKWTYSDIKGYCCTDSTDTYYEATNAPGFLRLKIFHYGRHTLSTWNNLKSGIFHMNVGARFYTDSGFSSVLSTDYLPEREIFTTYGLSFTDNERDYLGNDGSADISAVNVEMVF